MRERSLVAFTVLAQTGIGTLWALAGVRWAAGPAADAWLGGSSLAAAGLLTGAVGASAFHLGRPANAWRAAANLGSSWLSREILLLALVTVGALIAAVLFGAGLGPSWLRATVLVLDALLGLGLVYAMARVYRLRTVPTWNSPLTLASFAATAVSLGPAVAALGLALAGTRGPVPGGWGGAVRVLAFVAAAGTGTALVLALLRRRHGRRARDSVDPALWPGGGAGGWPVAARTALRVVGLLACLGAGFMAAVGEGSIGMAPVPLLLMLALAAAAPAEVLGRGAFYAHHARSGL